MIDISIIITFYNNINILKACLNSIKETTSKYCGNIQIIIVNDNPTIDLSSTKKIYEQLFDLQMYNMTSNCGYSAACNKGVSLSKYDNILLMDCDIIPSTGWIDELVKTYQNINCDGCVSANIIDMSTNKMFGYGFGIYGMDTIHFLQNREISLCPSMDLDFPIISSGCMMIPKKIYDKLGGQDELYINAFNDFALTYQNYKSGHKNRMSYRSHVFHRGHVAGNVRTNFYADSKVHFFKNLDSEIEKITITFLKKIYSKAEIGPIKKAISINFSNSLLRDDYVNFFAEAKDIEIIQRYDFKNIEGGTIILNDYLTWDICHTNLPIVYFCDDFLTIKNNYYWFSNRSNSNDIIFDRHANVIRATDLLSNVK